MENEIRFIELMKTLTTTNAEIAKSLASIDGKLDKVATAITRMNPDAANGVNRGIFNALVNIQDDFHKCAYNVENIANSSMYRTPKPDVTRIGLLTTDEYQRFYARIPRYGDFWWLDAKEEHPKEAPLVTKEAIVEKVAVTVNWGKIRPVLYVANGAEFAYKQIVRVGAYYFTYIGGDCLICNICLPEENVRYPDVLKWDQDEWESHLFDFE